MRLRPGLKPTGFWKRWGGGMGVGNFTEEIIRNLAKIFVIEKIRAVQEQATPPL